MHRSPTQRVLPQTSISTSDTDQVHLQLPSRPPILRTPPVQAFDSINLSMPSKPTVKLPSSFQGKEGVQTDIQSVESASTSTEVEERKPSTVRFKDFYDVLVPFTTQEEEPSRDPGHLLSYQEDSQLKEEQRQQQREESQALIAPLDLRNKIRALKTARDSTSVSTTFRPPNLSPT